MKRNPGVFYHDHKSFEQLNKYVPVYNDDIVDIYNAVSTSKVDVHILNEQMYWGQQEIERIEKFFLDNFPSLEDSKFIVYTLNEPRLLDNSLLVHFLISKLNVPPTGIIFISSTQQKDNQKLKTLGVHTVTMSKLGISFCGIAEPPTNNLPEDTDAIFNVENNKLFSCLTKRLTSQRFLITSLLHKEFTPSDYEMSAGVEYPEILEDYSIINHYIRESVLAGGDINFYKNLPLVFDVYPLSAYEQKYYQIRNVKLKNCLFDIVNETVGYTHLTNFSIDNPTEINHVTEKSFKHLFNYQIPIFNCSYDFIEYFKTTFKTDLFEDIVPMDKIYSKKTHSERAIEIVSFLKEFKKSSTLSKKDIKDRLMDNYKSIYRIFMSAGLEYKLKLQELKEVVIYK